MNIHRKGHKYSYIYYLEFQSYLGLYFEVFEKNLNKSQQVGYIMLY